MMLQDRKPKHLIALIQAPWFDLKDQAESTDAKRETRLQNAASALNYYHKTEAFGGTGNSLPIVIAEFPSEKIPLRIDQNNSNQSEHVHGYTLAWAVFAANWVLATSQNNKLDILQLNTATLKSSGNRNEKGKLLGISVAQDPIFEFNRKPLTQWLRWAQITRTVLARGAGSTILPKTDSLSQLFGKFNSINEAMLRNALSTRVYDLSETIAWFRQAFRDGSDQEFFDCDESLLNTSIDIDKDETACSELGIRKGLLSGIMKNTKDQRNLILNAVLAEPGLLDSIEEIQRKNKSSGISIELIVAAEIERRIHTHVCAQYPHLN
jgi:hypothetical protein